MNGIVVMATLLIAVGAGGTSQCDCTIFPFDPDPPCFDECSARLLAVASADELNTVVGLSADTSMRIWTVEDSEKPRDLAGYETLLRKEGVEELTRGLRALDQEQFERIREAALLRGDALEHTWPGPPASSSRGISMYDESFAAVDGEASNYFESDTAYVVDDDEVLGDEDAADEAMDDG